MTSQGYGPDGTVWGGEFLVGGYDGYRRAETPFGEVGLLSPMQPDVALFVRALMKGQHMEMLLALREGKFAPETLSTAERRAADDRAGLERNEESAA